ncbi:MAG: TlpA family protein disulfide reductase [Chitinophagaceae bacterium]
MNAIRMAGFALLILISTGRLKAQQIPAWKIERLEETIAQSTKPLVINFWATFCKPCVEEMPHFQQLADSFDVDLLFVSLDLQEDYPKKIVSFQKKLDIQSRIVWLDEFDADYFCPKVDSSWSGALPASLFVDRQSGYRVFREQVLSASQLRQAIGQLLDAAAHPKSSSPD